ncbi:larval/pupal cuticle protein H1C-like [Cryptotermes secundus]|uniref:larval/pupal cuticle protein H1C-like n=1 Tax=Cryptotermes secundus TaxID=105785 RepID=UPI000CD7CE58|nr:larval/pupal cuticle protein H1C-like [Cryptotermes secundus]
MEKAFWRPILFIVLAALVAVANAGILGAPALGYAAAPIAVHAPAIGTSQQSTIRTLDGNSAVSHYSKAVDSAFSSVRKYDTRISNDAVALAHATYAAPAIAAPLGLTHAAAPAIAAPLGVAYSAAPAVAHLTFDGLGAHYAY